MQSYKLNFLFFLCFIPFLLFGQDPYYINYDTKDGLPSSEVHAVEVDSNGILWFATDRGVCSYNGYEFKTYTTEDGLANNTLLAIWKDRKGNYWFPGLNGTLTIYDHEKFYPYKWNDSLKTTIHRPRNIAWDYESNLYFWRVGYNKSLYSINDKTGQVKLESFSDLVKQFPITKMKNTQFININGFFTPGGENYFGPIVINSDTVLFYCYKEKRLDDKGKYLFAYSKHNKNTEFYKFDAPILSLNTEKNGILSICTEKGLYRFNNGDIKVTPDHYFKDLIITDIAIDFEGNYWLTTTQNGIFKVPSFQYKTMRTPLNNYSSEKILSIATLVNHIFFGSSDGSLFGVDNNFNMDEFEEGDIGEQHWSASSTENYGYFKGLRISERNNKLNFFKIPSTYTFPGLYQLKNGQIFSLGFFEVRILSPEFKKAYYPSEYVFKKRIVSVVEQKNKILIGTADGLYSIKDYQYDSIFNETVNDSLLQVRINDLKLDNHENLWVSTIGNGLIYRTPDSIFQINVTNGLKSNFVNHVFVENDSSIWIATNKGLNNLIYSFKNSQLLQKKITSFTTTDGLLSNYVNSVTKWKDKIWIATNKGINYFSPNSLSKTAPPPPIILEEITVNDSLLKIDEYPDLNYSQNDLYFKFTGISYRKATDKPFYRYRIMNENTDSTWYYTNNRDVRFNDLQAGKYTFEAAAQNKYGQWSEKPIIYQFSISPHFTRTWWFLILCIIAVISSIVFMVQSRSKRIKLKEEQKRKLQEAELKTKDAELQALRNQMNPHFVFNALNSIQNFVFKNDAKKANYYLSRFSKLMRDGLQFARLKYILLEEEIVFLNTYLELEKMRFPDKFLYNVKVDDHIPINRYYIPPLLFQPILENAVKHAFKNIDYEGSLEIHFEEKIPGEILKITIIDNGEGINPNSVKKHTKSKNKSLGLEIISNQIALLNSEGKDNKASFKIFNRKSIDPQLYGTQAEFIISIKFSEND